MFSHSNNNEKGLEGPKGLAVEVQDACISYGIGKKKNLVLQKLQMTVEKGEIYGLLGPSGCGKTTLLSCIVGLRRLDSGTVTVLGGTPNAPGSAVPGKAVGYMPQSMSLFPEFSLMDTLRYFGRIHGMSKSEILDRSQFLRELLDLPEGDRWVKHMSGGQQRRLSLAVALLQKPKLLILDEPTVGVDPLLRQCIWSHLLDLSRNAHATVIITTHYIEEARQADTVALMRQGQILAEAPPDLLLTKYQLTTLEDVFLKLCRSVKNIGTSSHPEYAKLAGSSASLSSVNREREGNEPSQHPNGRSLSARNKGKSGSKMFGGVPAMSVISTSSKYPLATSYNNLSTDNPLATSYNNLATDNHAYVPEEGHQNFAMSTTSLSSINHGDEIVPPVRSIRRGTPRKPLSKGKEAYYRIRRQLVPTRNVLHATLVKNFLTMFRNLMALIFEIILPPIQISLFCMAMSGHPRDVPVGIINHEAVNDTFTCGVNDDFSCMFLNRLDKEMIKQVHYKSLDEAEKDVLDGKSWGTIEIPELFTQSTIDRFLSVTEADNATIDGSTIEVRLDMASQPVSLTLQDNIYRSFQLFLKDVMDIYELDHRLADLPIQVGKPYFGHNEISFAEYVAPGTLVVIFYFMAVGLTALGFVLEKRQGLIERAYVAGVTGMEILLAYLVTHLYVLILQVAMTLVFLLVVFEIPNQGSLFLLIVISLIQGLSGMTFGLVISALCDDETTTITVVLGTFLPCMMLCGMLWPTEAMLVPLNYISQVLPQTYATIGLRDLMSRGFGLERLSVVLALVVPSIYAILQGLLAGIIIWARGTGF